MTFPLISTQNVSRLSAVAITTDADLCTNTVEESGLGHHSPPCNSIFLEVETAILPKSG